ncbi:hypothetical protein CcaverHIS002_0400980 [Cutaneotrichosporon cavernicola]|uniref:DJ-1/PfpI domain-containing protein n=1 Tax=Cutaneotrichosporon cavernicola TaxID=279322 RepID=A0AA48QVF0_9TREE|nr:uncharacterized protein CcaverHIS019_0400950 [Cutaneotrichosporon cavernicola]BEI83494.1 hypothetical protein CcaverHIS002_0400980 [Cutaneotrichosporon cavernicola]BEI91275.1 hypothetical protein CcaverHIS019_0400950 [Cutaneotrichosporon cavernicola]BEI99048.1 hypothetical protein CcaverHIS631_0400910 [Cutaneotrichosporon cavernicola]BEJ06822.1 hypothetical protein CcaverHIS641_0400910 [Cutaneotrichosporon cavernicola]
MIHIGLLLFPDVQQLDIIGPHEMLTGLPGVQTHMVWKDLSPVRASTGLAMLPDTSFDSCPPLDVLVVPGGIGINPLLTDPDVVVWLRKTANSGIKYVTSVCTGSLLLASAGLLRGRRATSHWRFRDILVEGGAVPVKERIVTDREGKYVVMSGGGVTAGIDFALALAAELVGDDAAMGKQLYLEYAPAPPFDSGDPDTAPKRIVEAAIKATEANVVARTEGVRAGVAMTAKLEAEGK